MGEKDIVSLRLLNSMIGTKIAALGSDGKIDASIIPDTVRSDFVGSYTDLAALQAAVPTGIFGQYGLVAGTQYYWNTDKADWNNVEIELDAYNAMTDEQKNAQPEWIIIPNATT